MKKPSLKVTEKKKKKTLTVDFEGEIEDKYSSVPSSTHRTLEIAINLTTTKTGARRGEE